MKSVVRLLAVLVGVLLTVSVAGAQDEGGAAGQIRVAHLSPDAPAVEIYIDGANSGIQVLNYLDVSGWVQVQPGTYSVAVAPAFTSFDDAVLGPIDVTIGAGDWLTISAIGSVGGGTLSVGVVNEPIGGLDEGETSITVFHAIEDAPNVDVLFNGNALIQDLAFGTGTTITVPAGVYDTQVVAAGTTGPAVLRVAEGQAREGAYFFLAAANTLANPILVDAPGYEDDTVIDPLIAAGQNVNAPATVVDIALSSPNFSILVEALQAADLVGALQGPGPFTVFAPTNAAFEALLGDLGLTKEQLFADTDLLTSVLLFHVSPTRAFSTDVASVNGMTTLNGTGLNIGVDDTGVALDFGARILTADLEAQNGVVHVIDRVLLP